MSEEEGQDEALEVLEEYDQEERDYDPALESLSTEEGIKQRLLPSRWNSARTMEAFNDDGTIRKIIKARKSTFVHHLIHLDGKKFDFSGRDYLLPVYDRNDQDVLLKTARQVEKSTFLANNLNVSSVVTPYNKSLYVSPSHTQTRQFSSEKLKPVIERSPYIKTYFQDSSVSQQVFEKGFTNSTRLPQISPRP